MKEILRILVNIVLFVSAFSVIYIAIYLFRIDLKNKQINAQLDEEKDDCKLQICKLNERVTKLEKENNDEKRDSTRKDKTSNRIAR